MAKSRTVLHFGAGAGVGTLLGLIMGLSATPVVSAVLGAIAAGLLGLLGVGPHLSAHETEGSSPLPVLRILGFGSFCSIFLLIGILLRTHDVLAPSLFSQERALRSSHALTDSDVRRILLLKAFGLTEQIGERSAGNLQAAPSKSVAADSAGVLFGSSQEVCTVLRRDQYNSVSSYLQSLDVHGGAYSQLAKAISRASPQDQEQIASSLSELLCK